MVDTPPANDVPPMTQAAIASVSYPTPMFGCAALIFAVIRMPAIPAKMPLMTKVIVRVQKIFTPDAVAALMLPPTAYT